MGRNCAPPVPAMINKLYRQQVPAFSLSLSSILCAWGVGSGRLKRLSWWFQVCFPPHVGKKKEPGAKMWWVFGSPSIFSSVFFNLLLLALSLLLIQFSFCCSSCSCFHMARLECLDSKFLFCCEQALTVCSSKLVPPQQLSFRLQVLPGLCPGRRGTLESLPRKSDWSLPPCQQNPKQASDFSHFSPRLSARVFSFCRWARLCLCPSAGVTRLQFLQLSNHCVFPSHPSRKPQRHPQSDLDQWEKKQLPPWVSINGPHDDWMPNCLPVLWLAAVGDASPRT